MKVQAIYTNFVYAKQNASGKQLLNHYMTNSIKKLNDMFVKQNSQVSFTGIRKSKKQTQKKDELKKPKTEHDIAKSLKDIPLGGMSFLLGLATSAAMVKMGANAKKLLQSKNGYLVTGTGAKSDLLDIDRKSGVIEFAGTGINIDTNKCDIVDWDRGIFRNHDGSIDIDLMHNKFIDVANGILVDPSEKISAVLDGDKLQPVAIPSFTGYQTWPYPVIHSSSNPNIEERSKLGKLGEFICSLFEKDKMPQAEEVKDIFGNDIIVAKDKDGDTYLAPYLKSIHENPIFAKFTQGMDKETAAETINDLHLKQYVQQHYPSFGTRILIYEGGRNATGLGGIIEPHEIYNQEMADSTLEKLRADSTYIPKMGSEEAINFAKFQNTMLKLRGWKQPKIDPNLLLGKNTDLDDDGIADFDRTGDGIINYSTKGKPNSLSKLKFLFGIADKDGDGKVSKEEISEFISSMDANNDGKISLSEFFGYFKGLF